MKFTTNPLAVQAPQGSARPTIHNDTNDTNHPIHKPDPKTIFTTATAIAPTQPSFHQPEPPQKGKLTSSVTTHCTRCGHDTRGTPLLLKPAPNMPGLQRVPKPLCSPFCIPCADALAHAWLEQHRSLRQLPEDERRARKIGYLLCRCSRREEGWVADHFQFCRCCLAPNAHVSAPGACCEACEDVPRCGACGVFKRVVIQQGEKLVCLRCAKERANGRAGRADKVSGRAERNVKCERCKKPTGRALWKHCAQCREGLRCLLGAKCTRCKIVPRPEGYRRCESCRSLDRKGAASRGYGSKV